MQDTLGKSAGAVFEALSQNGRQSVTKLKNTTKLDTFTLHAAIGWLAREDKLAFSKKGKSVLIDLK